MESDRICCIFNLAASYRESIYKLMDRKIECDFYIGNKTSSPMKIMQYESLTGFRGMLFYMPLIFRFYWQRGIHKAMFNSRYKTYILTGDPFCLSNWMLLAWARMTRRYTILWTHGWYGDETLLKKYVKKLFYKLSNRILLYGDYARRLMIKEGITASKMFCIYNSLNYDRQLQVRSELRRTSVYRDYFGNDHPTLLYIGRLQKIKRLDLIVEAMHKLMQKGIPTNFIYIGHSIEELDLEPLIAHYGLQQAVWAYGALFDEERIGELMYNADLCISPGNVGLTAMHALTYGLPVITHDNFSHQMPEFEAIEDGRTGLFFRENDADDLGRQIEHWLALSQERPREAIAADCQRIIDQKYNPYYQIGVIRSVINER